MALAKDQQNPHSLDASDGTGEQEALSTPETDDESPPVQISDDRFLRFRNGMR